MSSGETALKDAADVMSCSDTTSCASSGINDAIVIMPSILTVIGVMSTWSCWCDSRNEQEVKTLDLVSYCFGFARPTAT